MIAEEHTKNGTVDTQRPAFQALLKHALECDQCMQGAYCVTGVVLIKTLCEASGEGE